MAEPAPGRRAIVDSIAADLKIVRRAAWGAKPQARVPELDWDYTAIVIHNTGHGSIDTMPKIQDLDQNTRGWDDVAYHYAVRADGVIFEGRELVYKGSDVRNQNTGKIGIVCIGDYDKTPLNWLSGRAYAGDAILPAMLDSVRRLTVRLRSSFPIVFFGGHIEYGDTADCPGSEMLPKVAEMRAALGFKVPIKRPGL